MISSRRGRGAVRPFRSGARHKRICRQLGFCRNPTNVGNSEVVTKWHVLFARNTLPHMALRPILPKPPFLKFCPTRTEEPPGSACRAAGDRDLPPRLHTGNVSSIVLPMKLTWSRTVIGKQTKPYDFAACDGAEPVGRIYRHSTSGGRPTGFGRCRPLVPASIVTASNAMALVETKTEAVRLVEKTYDRCRLDQPPGLA